MLELLAVFVIAAVLGGVAGAVAAFTHQLFIAKAIAKLHAEYEKLETVKDAASKGLQELKAKL